MAKKLLTREFFYNLCLDPCCVNSKTRHEIICRSFKSTHRNSKPAHEIIVFRLFNFSLQAYQSHRLQLEKDTNECVLCIFPTELFGLKS